jgi:hypothetical protein
VTVTLDGWDGTEEVVIGSASEGLTLGPWEGRAYLR